MVQCSKSPCTCKDFNKRGFDGKTYTVYTWSDLDGNLQADAPKDLQKAMQLGSQMISESLQPPPWLTHWYGILYRFEGSTTSGMQQDDSTLLDATTITINAAKDTILVVGPQNNDSRCDNNRLCRRILEDLGIGSMYGGKRWRFVSAGYAVPYHMKEGTIIIMTGSFHRELVTYTIAHKDIVAAEEKAFWTDNDYRIVLNRPESGAVVQQYLKANNFSDPDPEKTHLSRMAMTLRCVRVHQPDCVLSADSGGEGSSCDQVQPMSPKGLVLTNPPLQAARDLTSPGARQQPESKRRRVSSAPPCSAAQQPKQEQTRQQLQSRQRQPRPQMAHSPHHQPELTQQQLRYWDPPTKEQLQQREQEEQEEQERQPTMGQWTKEEQPEMQHGQQRLKIMVEAMTMFKDPFLWVLEDAGDLIAPERLEEAMGERMKRQQILTDFVRDFSMLQQHKGVDEDLSQKVTRFLHKVAVDSQQLIHLWSAHNILASLRGNFSLIAEVTVSQDSPGKTAKSNLVRVITKFSVFTTMAEAHLRNFDPASVSPGKLSEGLSIAVQEMPEFFKNLWHIDQGWTRFTAEETNYRIVFLELSPRYTMKSKKYAWHVAGRDVRNREGYQRVIKRFLRAATWEKTRQHFLIINGFEDDINVPWPLGAPRDFGLMPIVLWLGPQKP